MPAAIQSSALAAADIRCVSILRLLLFDFEFDFQF